jgi:branched-chain amino acid transport system ATP-binding protein
MLLEVKGLIKNFAGLIAVNNINFSIQKGEILGLIGPNGAGKTTIFNMISGFFPPTKGRIFFREQDITGLKPPQICRLGIARTFQIVKPLSRMTVLENVMVGAFSRIKDARDTREKAIEVLKFTEQLPKKDMKASSLTLGERKKLEISRALATEPNLMMLDECMAGLNIKEISDAIQLIGKIRERGITLIVIEHVMKAIMTISDRVVVLNYGEKIMEGTPEEVANDRQVIEAYLGEDYAQGK